MSKDASAEAGSNEAGSDAGSDAAPVDGGSDAGSDAETDAEPLDATVDGAACTPFDASGLDEASVAAGFEQTWQVYRCYGCHQLASQTVTDAGAGIVLSGNNNGLGDSGTIFPPNLTSDPMTGLGCWSDSQIVDAILNGAGADGRTLCKPMPKFSQAQFNADGGAKAGYPMDAATAQEIVDFLRSLPVVSNAVHATTCAVADASADGEAADAEATDASSADASADASSE